MGSCFSCSVFADSDQLLPPPAAAKVVSINGSLRQYNVPVFASQVLDAEAASSSSSSTSFFLCNSDLLSYDDFIPALDSNAQLYANQLYFVLPKSKLQNRLTASDMAALAVKASVALQSFSKKDAHRRHKKARISPVLLLNQSSSSSSDVNAAADAFKTFDKANKGEPRLQHPQGFGRSGSVRKLQKYTSRRAKLAVRSFKLRLSTIYEGTVL